MKIYAVLFAVRHDMDENSLPLPRGAQVVSAHYTVNDNDDSVISGWWDVLYSIEES